MSDLLGANKRMKIDELIEKLQEAKEKIGGDKEVIGVTPINGFALVAQPHPNIAGRIVQWIDQPEKSRYEIHVM